MSSERVTQVVAVIIVSLGLVAGLAWWAAANNTENDSSAIESVSLDATGTTTDTDAVTSDEQSLQLDEPTMERNPIATIVTNRGEITLELFGKDMPITVENFVTLAQEGFYDETKFHRVIEDFMIQGGDPNSRSNNTSEYGTGGPGYTIADEFVEAPHLTNVSGTVAMANTGQPNSGGSQFFINVADNTNLDFDQEPLSSKHPVFGKVIEGMDVVRAIEQVETGVGDVPLDPVVVQTIEIQ
jgi:peptidylprolyl isomerase